MSGLPAGEQFWVRRRVLLQGRDGHWQHVLSKEWLREERRVLPSGLVGIGLLDDDWSVSAGVF